jgi:hypothetical protein
MSIAVILNSILATFVVTSVLAVLATGIAADRKARRSW